MRAWYLATALIHRYVPELTALIRRSVLIRLPYFMIVSPFRDCLNSQVCPHFVTALIHRHVRETVSRSSHDPERWSRSHESLSV